MKPTILVATTSRWFPTARLAVALAQAGFTVDAVCPPRHPLGKTRAVAQICPYRGLAPLRSFVEAIAARRPDLILPGDDLATRHLHHLYSRENRQGRAGSPICQLIERSLGAAESFSVVYARTAFMQLAQEEGIRIPRTEIISNTHDLRAWVARMGFPTVLKADCTSGGEGVRVVHTIEQAEQAYRRLQAPPLLARAAKRALVDQDKTLIWPSLLRHRSVVNVQAFVAGREATSTVACWNGAVLASLHFEVLNKRSSAGPATVLRLIENAEMSGAAEKIARRLNLSGVHGLDFMLEADTGNAYLIEIAAVSEQTVQPAPKLTEKDTIALFPHEWLRDPGSVFLQSGYHDVPWEEPELVRACIRKRLKQSAWYSQRNWTEDFGRSSPSSMSSLAKDRTAEVRCEAE